MAGDAERQAGNGRRTFLARLSMTLGGVIAAIGGVPFIGLLVSPTRRDEPDVWRPMGPVEDFPPGATVKVSYRDPSPLPWAGFAAESAALVRREPDGSLVAFSIYCTHVGCPVRWVEGAQLFLCPCHGGAFHRDGTVAAGPPPRPLARHEVRQRNGLVELRTRRVPLPT